MDQTKMSIELLEYKFIRITMLIWNPWVSFISVTLKQGIMKSKRQKHSGIFEAKAAIYTLPE